MPSETQVKCCLEKEDYGLLKVALRKYNIKESKFLKDIIHSWLFTNKLHFIEDKK